MVIAPAPFHAPVRCVRSLGSGALIDIMPRASSSAVAKTKAPIMRRVVLNNNTNMGVGNVTTANEDEDDLTASSTADEEEEESFVLATVELFSPLLKEDSLEDHNPYLLVARNMRQRHDPQQLYPMWKQQQHVATPQPLSIHRLRRLAQYGNNSSSIKTGSKNAKSLGSFAFPMLDETSFTNDDDENDNDTTDDDDEDDQQQSLSAVMKEKVVSPVRSSSIFAFSKYLSIPKKQQTYGDVPSSLSKISTNEELSVRSSFYSADSSRPDRRVALEKVAYYCKALEQCCSGGTTTAAAPLLKRARVQLQLGSAHATAMQLELSIPMFLAAAEAFIKANKFVAAATALGRAGMAYCTARQWESAVEHLQQAFAIRHAHLGAWHVDTVDTLNQIGNVHMFSGNASQARRCYWEVFWVRKAIFGSNHPSVAVSAHELGNALYSSGLLEDADNFYQIAASIYDTMGMTTSHPCVARLFRNMKRLERVERCISTNERGTAQSTA
jgi:tetratricopeptide (TPR) repeat protein